MKNTPFSLEGKISCSSATKAIISTSAVLLFISTTVYAQIPGCWYRIAPKDRADASWDLPGLNGQSGSLTIYSADGGTDQMWYVREAWDWQRELIPRSNLNKRLDIPSQADFNGNQLQVHDENGSAAQRFYLWDFGGGDWEIKSVFGTQRALDLAACNTANDNKIQLWDKNQSNCQKWRFHNVGKASVYEHCGYGGAMICLVQGDYDLGDLNELAPVGWNVNDWISSVKVNSGWKMTVFENAGFSGASRTFSGDNDCLVDEGMNDRISSLKVFKDNGSSVITTGGGSALIGLNGGKEMTIQIRNNTNGAWSNDQIYTALIALNGSGQWCNVTPDGAMHVCSEADNTDNGYVHYFRSLSQVGAGYQVPTVATSARMYFSVGQKLRLKVINAGGAIGIVQPDLNNPSDPNRPIIFDWIEFTVQPNHFWGNTTQVDQFGFPVTMEMYQDNGAGGYRLYKRVGITESRASIFAAFRNLPDGFSSLIEGNTRIHAPCKGAFRVGREFGNYFQGYVNQIWEQYRYSDLEFDHPLGHFKGRVQGDNRFRFTLNGGGEYYIHGKPNNNEVFEGSGVLASGNSVELALQAQICAALNRHVVSSPWAWGDAGQYYRSSPANHYARFWHEHSLGGLAYGFCYDDVADKSTLIDCPNPRGMVIGIGWDTPMPAAQSVSDQTDATAIDNVDYPADGGKNAKALPVTVEARGGMLFCALPGGLGGTTVTIFNLQGKIIAAGTIANPLAHTYQLPIGSASLAAGSYFINLRNSGMNVTRSIALCK